MGEPLKDICPVYKNTHMEAGKFIPAIDAYAAAFLCKYANIDTL
jgi:hypothetical protein